MKVASEFAVTSTGLIIYHPTGHSRFDAKKRDVNVSEHGEVKRIYSGDNIADYLQTSSLKIKSNINAGVTKDGYIVEYPDDDENEEIRQQIEASIGKVLRVQYGDNVLNKISEAFSEFCGYTSQTAVSGETGNISKL